MRLRLCPSEKGKENNLHQSSNCHAYRHASESVSLPKTHVCIEQNMHAYPSLHAKNRLLKEKRKKERNLQIDELSDSGGERGEVLGERIHSASYHSLRLLPELGGCKVLLPAHSSRNAEPPYICTT